MSEDQPPAEPAPSEATENPEPAAEPEPHDDDGLDLARAIARAAAGAGSAPARRHSGGGSRRAGPSRGTSDGRLGRWSGAHPDDRDPQPLAGEVAKIVEGQGWELSLRLRGVFARWAELVGEELAEHCTPESFVDGKLVVRTDSTAWATQLRLLTRDVLKRLNDDLGDGTVTLMEVLGPQGPSWKNGRRSVRGGRGPRDTYG